MEIRSQVREFIVSNFYVPDTAELGDETSLLDQGIIDSTGVIEIITFLEDRFGISVAEREVVADNMSSIAQIGAYIDRKLGVRRTA